MTLMLSNTYAAFKAAGVSDSEAQAAAVEIAEFASRLGNIERQLSLLTWMVGGIYVIGAPSLWLLLRIAAKIGALS